MNDSKSDYITLSHPEIGPCEVCDTGFTRSMIDRITGIKYAGCCMEAMARASAVLQIATKKFGYVHPTHEA